MVFTSSSSKLVLVLFKSKLVFTSSSKLVFFKSEAGSSPLQIEAGSKSSPSPQLVPVFNLVFCSRSRLLHLVNWFSSSIWSSNLLHLCYLKNYSAIFKIMNLKGLKLQLPPSPPQLPIIGNLHQLGALPHQSFMKLSQKYGPVMLLKFGRIPFVIISSAEAAREVLKVHDLDSCSRAQLAGSRKLTHNYLDIAFAPYGDYWRHIRKISVLELFSLKRVQSFRFIREEEVAPLMNSISQSASSATPVDLSEKIYICFHWKYSFQDVFRAKFSRELSYLDNQKFEKLVHATESIVGGFTTEECIPYVGWIIDRLNGYHAKLEKVFHELNTFFEKAIEN
ncbi:hypothetical protein EZV62_017491 [Acer yangbiense]|uniref:Cytochrome P450 n=1 Tax=Acer yangbiense TaxID=1000413 RepID=A0A5C7HHB0_9ROSI|nr:hypothetical protein EZV62_017491 [Acer yangbiense]